MREIGVGETELRVSVSVCVQRESKQRVAQLWIHEGLTGAQLIVRHVF